MTNGRQTLAIHNGVMHIADDPTTSERLRAFLRQWAERVTPTSEQLIRSEAGQVHDDGRMSATVPAEVVEAMVEFEDRYGGLAYKLLVGNYITYGLEDEPQAFLTEHGWAFVGIFDGDLTWRLHVLADGRVAVDYGSDVEYRILNRSVRQRLESHALLAGLRQWPHRSFEFAVRNKVQPPIGSAGLPAAVPEASGISIFWWYDGSLAFFAELQSWIYDGMDRWNLWAFATEASVVPDVRALPAFEAVQPRESPWCYLCGTEVSEGQACVANL